MALQVLVVQFCYCHIIENKNMLVFNYMYLWYLQYNTNNEFLILSKY